MRTPIIATAVATALVVSFAATTARADTGTNDWHDGPFQLRLRGVYAHPDTGSDAFTLGGTQIPGNQAKLDSEFYPELSGEYYFTDSLSTELAVALPTKFKASIAGTAIGSEKLMPNTWTLKYAFNVPETFRPYLGAGVHYTDISSQQLGIPAGSFSNPGVARAWFVNLDARYLGNLTTKLNESATGTELTNLKIDPWLFSVGIGYRFGGSPIVAAPIAAAVVAPAVVAPPPPPPPPPAPVAKVDPDSDGDGVPDSIDQCPNTPRGTRVDKIGCSCDISQEVHFATGSAVLTEQDKVLLDQLVPLLQKVHFANGEIEGHTDSTGGKQMNQKLSERRAQAVAAYLASHGIVGGRVTTIGYGETKPVDSNQTKEGRAHNRRVVIRRTDCGN